MNLSNKSIFFILLLNFFTIGKPARSGAQTPDSSPGWKGWSIDPTFKFGSVFKHTPKFKPDILSSSISFELGFSKQLFGKKTWQQFTHYPEFGIAIGYAGYGNPGVLGHGFYILPNINLKVIGSQTWQLRLHFGTGLALLNKYYNVLTDSTNNVIGSAVNNVTSISLGARWQPDPKWSVNLGASLTHFSVGDFSLPNLGINIAAAQFTLQYTPDPVLAGEYIHHALPRVNHKILYEIKLEYGSHEFRPPGGPQYPVDLVSFAAGPYVSRSGKLMLGADIAYVASNYYFIVTHDFFPRSQWFEKSLSATVFLNYEFQFGNLAFPVQFGTYVYRPMFKPGLFYEKIGVKYYFHTFGKEPVDRLSLGVNLVTTGFNADYLDVALGFQF